MCICNGRLTHIAGDVKVVSVARQNLSSCHCCTNSSRNDNDSNCRKCGSAKAFSFFPSLRMCIYACANNVASFVSRIAFIAWLVVRTGWIGLIWFGLLLIFTFYRCWLLVIWVRRSQAFCIVFFGIPTYRPA